MKSFQKSKSNPKAVAKFRIPKNFRGKIFGGKKRAQKVQHRG